LGRGCVKTQRYRHSARKCRRQIPNLRDGHLAWILIKLVEPVVSGTKCYA
jgi:hypothetical protein